MTPRVVGLNPTSAANYCDQVNWWTRRSHKPLMLGSIPRLATTLYIGSSIGRAATSKVVGCRFNSCPVCQLILSWSELDRHLPTKEIYAGSNPAGSANYVRMAECLGRRLQSDLAWLKSKCGLQIAENFSATHKPLTHLVDWCTICHV